ncbi:MAG: NAD(P)-dependent oxidoreductase [Phycisphaerae bacterium]
MRVYIADKFEQFGIDELRHSGCDVSYEPGKKGAEFAAAVRDSACRVLVVRSTKVPREVIAAANELALIVRAGAGVDNIDVAAASAHSVLVANCPGMNAIAVAELTLALVLSLDRRVPDATADLRAGKWNKTEYAKAAGLKGRTLGLLGLGPIGRAVAARAAAFEMNVVAWSRSWASPAAALPGVHLKRAAREVAELADVVSVHLASTPQTRGLVDRAFFEAMRPGASFVNTSRGDLVDTAALTWAVKEKKLRVGLDVWAAEPAAAVADFADPLLSSGGVVYGTPHVAASTEQAQMAIAAETVRLVRRFRDTGRVDNCVNLSPRSAAQHILIVRHRNRPGVLAHVLSHLGAAGLNVEEMENTILADQATAVARIAVSGAPADALLGAIRGGNDAILALSVVELPAAPAD